MENACVSLKNLWDEGIKKTKFGYEVVGSAIDTDCLGYYDLYDKDGEIVCMDGEEVTILEEFEDGVTLQVEDNRPFKLSKEEWKIVDFRVS